MTYRYTEHPQLHFTILHSPPSTSPKLISNRVPRRLAISARFSTGASSDEHPLTMQSKGIAALAFLSGSHLSALLLGIASIPLNQ